MSLPASAPPSYGSPFHLGRSSVKSSCGRPPSPPASIQPALASYLQKRHYVNPSSQQENVFNNLRGGGGNTGVGLSSRTKSISLDELALKEVVRLESSTNDLVRYGDCPVLGDPIAVDQHYTKFKLWISESADFYEPELARLLYPLFTHLYLELIANGQQNLAQKFFLRHQSTFLGNAEFAKFIGQLGTIHQPQDISNNSMISSYVSSKYSVTLGSRTFEHVVKFLRSRNLPILLFILQTKVDVKLADPSGASSKVEAVARLKKDKEDNSTNVYGHPNPKKPPKVAPFQESGLREVFRRVREDIPQPLPTVCLYRLDKDDFTCARVTADCEWMAAGSQDSSISVWSVLPPQSRQKAGDRLKNKRIKGQSSRRIHGLCKEQNRPFLGCDKIAPQFELSEVLRDETGEARIPMDQTEKKKIKQENDFLSHGNSNSETSSSSINKEEDSTHFYLKGHSGRVFDLSFLPKQPSLPSGDKLGAFTADAFDDNSGVERRFLVSVSEDCSMRLWDLECRANVSVYKGHSFPVWSVDVDKLGNVVTGSMDKTARLWNLEYLYPLRIYAGHEGDVDIVKFHPNCNYLATGSANDKSVRLWSHADAKMVRVFTPTCTGPNSTGAARSLAFSPDGSMLAVGEDGGGIRIWDLATSSVIKEFQCSTTSNCTVNSLCWDSTSSLIATGGTDEFIRIWNVKNSSMKMVNGIGNGEKSSLPNASYTVPMAQFTTKCSNIFDLTMSKFNNLTAVGGFASISKEHQRSINIKMEVKAEKF